jgi:hypothetical protein
MIRVIMNSAGGVTAVAINFLLPSAAKLRATITATKVTSMIKINFNVTRNNIFISSGIYYHIKVLGSPWLTRSIMTITQLAVVLHTPTIVAFCRTLLLEHDFSLLFLVGRIV